MLYITRTTGMGFAVTEKNGFYDVETPFNQAESMALISFFEDYNEVQEYLAQVFQLNRQGAYAASRALEVPECLKTIVDQPEEATDEKQPNTKDTEAPSSGTLHLQPQPAE